MRRTALRVRRHSRASRIPGVKAGCRGLSGGSLTAAFLAKQITVSALDTRGDGRLYWLASTGEATSGGYAGTPFQAHLIAFALEAFLGTGQAVWAGSVTLEPLCLARPAPIVEAITWGRHAARRKDRRVASLSNPGRDGTVLVIWVWRRSLQDSKVPDVRCPMSGLRRPDGVQSPCQLIPLCR